MEGRHFYEPLGFATTGKTRRKRGQHSSSALKFSTQLCRICFSHFHQILIDVEGHKMVVQRAGSLLVERSDTELALDKRE